MLVGHRYRRRLPHFQSERRTYLVTFVTFERWILPPLARDIALEETIRVHEEQAHTHRVVVMPDHEHIVLTPLTDHHGFPIGLHEILKRIKGRSARLINKSLDRSGPVWLDESFDHELRHDESLQAKCEYVRQNPVRAGLVSRSDEYRWAWSDCPV